MDEMPRDGFRQHPAWLLGVVGLLLAQAGLVAAMFGPQPLRSLTDDRPIVSGRHPLHLYHGALGSQTFYHTGATACFDPSFQAGYPKTPVFDGGSRPAEFFLALAGGGYKPVAYKLGVFAILLLAPLAFVAGARGIGLPASSACLAGVAGIALLWSPPVRTLINEGHMDVLAAGLSALVFVTWLARYTTHFGVDAWFVLAGISVLGWYAHPLVWLGLLPLVTAYYVVYAPKHGLAWHLGLMGISAVGLAPNLWWLWDWGRYWWLRQPYPVGEFTPWSEVLGTPSNYTPLLDDVPGGALTLALGGVGLVLLARSGQKAAAWLLPSTILLALLAYRIARVRTDLPINADDTVKQLLPFATGFMLLPAAYAMWRLACRARMGAVLPVMAVVLLVGAGWLGTARPFARLAGLQTAPIPLGLSADQNAIVEALIEHTTTEARILWDEPSDSQPTWNWSALLPQLTGRSFLGGLDADAGVEHWFCGQMIGILNGQPLEHWTDAQLGEFCRRYNIGWVAARSPEAIARWSRVGMAKVAARLREGDREVILLTLDRPRSFILIGSGRWDEASTRHICLSNVVPDAQGCVELSLHFQQDMKVYPSYVTIELTKDASDPISHVRLQAPGPVPRVMLVWEP